MHMGSTGAAAAVAGFDRVQIGASFALDLLLGPG